MIKIIEQNSNKKLNQNSIHNIDTNYPSLSIAIPTYNESVHIEKLIRDFLSTKYQNLIEIFVADGGSTDGTQDIVQKLSTEDPRVKLIHNPEKIQSAGLNLIIKESTGDIFLRADAHSDYASDYIEKCVEALLKSKALNVGGAQRFVAKNAFQSGIALATKSLLGSGGAKYRNPNYHGYADTVYLGCFWRKVLVDIGGFDTILINNEDAELNQKLLTKSHQAIYISSDIKVWYYPRKNWKSLFIQYLKYGRGRYLTATKHRQQLQIRGKLPFLVLSVIFSMMLIDLIVPQMGLPMEKVIIIGLLIPFLESFRVTCKFADNLNTEIWQGSEDSLPSYLSVWFFCGLSLLTMPFAHFCGYTYQMLKRKLIVVFQRC
ncbi:MAG: glycosyltransferase family 2 protein [Mastigocoleus sp.]